MYWGGVKSLVTLFVANLLCSGTLYAQIDCRTVLPSNFTADNSSQPAAPLSHICTDANSVKYVEVNYHFIQKSDGTGNFGETSDGLGSTAMDGYRWAELVVKSANDKLEANPPMWLPNTGVPNPTVASRMRYVLKGVYFHKSDADYNRQHWEISTINATYGINKATEINVFSYNLNADGVASTVATPSASAGDDRLACGINDWTRYYKVWGYTPTNNWTALQSGVIFDHEIGHLLGLWHTWAGDDGCVDTPNNPNCWSYNTTNPNCDSWSEITNNMMDYGENSKTFSPCQVGRMHTRLNLNSALNNYIHSCDGCAPVAAFSKMRGTRANGVNINAMACFNEDKYLVEICEIASNNPSASCTATGVYYNSGWITGQAGVLWLGNAPFNYVFTPDKYYRVKIKVASNSCPGIAETVQIFKAGQRARDVYRLGGAEENAVVENVAIEGIYPNPVRNELTVSYQVIENTPVRIEIMDCLGRSMNIAQSTELSQGFQTISITTDKLPAGSYYITTQTENKIISKSFIKY